MNSAVFDQTRPAIDFDRFTGGVRAHVASLIGARRVHRLVRDNPPVCNDAVSLRLHGALAGRHGSLRATVGPDGAGWASSAAGRSRPCHRQGAHER